MSGDKKQFFHEMISLYYAHRAYNTRYYASLGLSPGQPKVLHVLYDEEGYLQKDLAARCRVEPATMTSLLSKMEKQDMIKKETVYVSGGKRAYAIFLTDHGRRLAKQVSDKAEQSDELALDGLSDEETESLISLMRRARTNLENHLDDNWEGTWK
ncbi:MAG: winged helix-turn-helix transcriptional regulator [Lachnospiraceae bacterium]|nr:winged helix-turn-helix transcriptional regulator [Lachnospiraceae bacterium]